MDSVLFEVGGREIVKFSLSPGRLDVLKLTKCCQNVEKRRERVLH